jgi:hypothetical protein
MTRSTTKLFTSFQQQACKIAHPCYNHPNRSGRSPRSGLPSDRKRECAVGRTPRITPRGVSLFGPDSKPKQRQTPHAAPCRPPSPHTPQPPRLPPHTVQWKVGGGGHSRHKKQKRGGPPGRGLCAIALADAWAQNAQRRGGWRV